MTLNEFAEKIEAMGLTWDIGWKAKMQKEVRVWDWPHVVYRYSSLDESPEKMLDECFSKVEQGRKLKSCAKCGMTYEGECSHSYDLF